MFPGAIFAATSQTLTHFYVSLHPFQTSKFLNFNDYTNFLPSFHIQLAANISTVELQLSSYVTSLHLIGWLFGSTNVWHRVVHLTGQANYISATC